MKGNSSTPDFQFPYQRKSLLAVSYVSFQTFSVHILCHINGSILDRLLNLAFFSTKYLEIILYWHIQIDLILFLVVVVFQFNFVFGIGNTFKRFKNQNRRNRNTLRSLTPIPVSLVGVPLPPWASTFISVSFQGLFIQHSLYFLCVQLSY